MDSRALAIGFLPLTDSVCLAGGSLEFSLLPGRDCVLYFLTTQPTSVVFSPSVEL